MKISIRAERPEDYNEIVNLIYDSFVRWHEYDYKTETILTAALRHSQYYDPELSIVAEVDHKIIGHAFFSPFEFIVMGELKKGIYLAPLCVAVNMQKQGIGAKLMEAGHEIASKKGYSLALLCGHEDYYPKFGYLNNMFTFAGTKLTLTSENISTQGIQERPVFSNDLEWVVPKWKEIHKKDRLACYPGDKISQWFNHSPSYRSSVLTRENKILGYIKYKVGSTLEVQEIMPLDENAEEMLAYIQLKHTKCIKGEIVMSLSMEYCNKLISHCNSISAEAFIYTNPCFMLKVLDQEDNHLLQYCKEAAEDISKLGILSFPPIMNIDD